MTRLPSFTFLLACVFLAQGTILAGPGDTIRVQTIDFNTPPMPGWNAPREGKYLFPPDSISFSKILMYYTLKCDPNQNPACGEWDYTTNTYLHYHTGLYDSNLYTHPNFIVDGGTPDTFAFMDQSSWQYLPRKEYFNNTVGNFIPVGASSGDGFIVFPEAGSGRSQFLYTQQELTEAGLVAGNITGLDFLISQTGSNVQKFTLRLKNAAQGQLDISPPTGEGFTTVFSRNFDFSGGTGWRVFSFAYPFFWDGTSNIILEISYSDSHPSTGIRANTGPALPHTSIAGHGPDFYLDFEGTDYVDVPADVVSSLDSAVTVCFWQYGDPLFQPQNDVLFAATDSAGNRVLNVHLPWSDGRIYWDAGNSSGYDRIYVMAPNASWYEGTWNHWAFIKDCRTGKMKILRNGELVAYALGKYKPLNGIRNFTIGSYPDRSMNYDGMVDEFQVWDVALEDSIISQWMYKSADESHPSYDHLLACFPFNEGNGLTSYSAAPSGGMSSLGGYPNWLPVKENERTRDFSAQDSRPHVAFEQGNYNPATLDSLIVVDSLTRGQLMAVIYSDSLHPLIPTDTLPVWPEYHSNYVYDPDGQAIDSSYVTPDGYLYRQDWPYYGAPYELTVPYELARYITPYGNGLSLGDGFTWIYDVTDFRPLLKDSVHLTAGNFQELLDLDFYMIEGTPPREVYRIDRLWNGYYSLGNFENLLPADTVVLPDSAAGAKLKIITSGHEWDNPTNCAEFCQKNHWVTLDGSTVAAWQILNKCSTNPLYPQGGTWTYDRAGWCPGAKVAERHIELTPYLDGDTVILDYHCDPDPYGAYSVSSYLFSYGPPSYSMDAELTEILAPNDQKFYGRIMPDSAGPLFNPICGQPVVRIRNSGSDTLTSLVIVYGPESGSMKTFQWTGSLAFMESAEAVLDPIDWNGYTPGNNGFVATLSLPNGGQDENPLNNTVRSTFALVPEFPNEFILTLKTNHRGFENRWEIIGENGEVVIERGNFGNDEVYADTILLDDGCYTFRITDTGDDGLSHWASSQGSGYINFRNVNGNVMYSPNSDFGYFTAKSFTVGLGVSAGEREKEDHISVFPNPTGGRVYVAFSLMEERKVTIRIIDLTGKVLMMQEEVVNNGLVGLDLEGFAGGIYSVVIESEEGITVKKVVLY